MTRRPGSLVVRACCPRGNLWLLLLSRHGPHLLHHLHLLNCGSDEFLKREAGVEKEVRKTRLIRNRLYLKQLQQLHQ